MCSVAARKAHAVCVPYPSQGHVTPMMQLAKLLHSRGFHITFVNTEFNHRRLFRSKEAGSLEGFRFETIPDGLPPSDRDATQDVPSLCASTRKNCLPPFLELLGTLNSSLDVPKVTCIISDGIMSFGIKAAQVLGIPQVQFWTASACGFMGYLHYSELLKRGIIPFKGENFTSDGSLDAPIDWIPGMPNIQLKDIPSFIRTTNLDDIMLNFMGGEAQNCLNAHAMIFNTFDAMEHQVLDAIKYKFCSNIYTSGPHCMLERQIPNSQFKSLRSSLWKEDKECLEWLDKREPNSVVYVNYGSITVMTSEQFEEFAWGLANSKHPFLWIVRPDIMDDDSVTIPKEFLKETKNRGLLASWCAQDQVLSHPSVGAFLTHCGWNSMLESISGGVPVICWPFFAEQQTNCRYACDVWGIGLEVNHDVKREEIESIVREMMQGEKGKEMRKNALELKMKAEEATHIGGSSYNNFERFIKEALHYSS